MTERTPDAVQLGARLKRVRELAGLSQRELAKRAGMPNSSISTFEQGQVSPSVQSLSRLLAAVPISMAQFFAEAGTGDGILVLGADQWLPQAKLAGIRRHRLVDERMVTERWTLAPGADTGSAPLTMPADASGVVILGEPRLTVGLQVFSLHPEDGFYLAQGKSYRLQNPADVEVVIILTSLASAYL